MLDLEKSGFLTRGTVWNLEKSGSLIVRGGVSRSHFPEEGLRW
jgi:hypothetical protein